jgi:hypothetical protein
MKHEVKALPKEEVLANRAKAYGFIDFDNCKDCNKSLKDCTCINDTLDMKQETLEEVAENESEYLADYEDKEAYQKAFIAGAKWQQERSYSEEEVKQAFKVGFSIGYGSDIYAIDEKNRTCEEWFEQFKKK